MTTDYTIAEVEPYINWAYFYHAWQVRDHDGQQRLRSEAERWLESEAAHRYSTHAVFMLCDVRSDGDDILMSDGTRLPFLRQQSGSPTLCLADFVSPVADRMGLFATSTDSGMETDFADDPYQRMMAQLLADRLAEATAELLHLQVRRRHWGYAPDEHLSMDDLHRESFQGIRPAVGYPSLPDTSFNFLLDRLLGMRRIGITLTESGAMRPHASVSGLMFSHPSARYFAVGTIGEDQLADYARRRGMPVQTMRRFLSSNL